MRYFIRFCYDGSKFYGFQRLNDNRSVQKCLEDALFSFSKKSVTIKGAGRTDRGVHANGQCAHFDLDCDVPCQGLQKFLNKVLAPYIYIFECKNVSYDFHARFSAVEKVYRYRIYLGTYNPCLVDYVYECPYDLDIELMQEVSTYFLGIHNFQNFVSGEREHYQAIISDIHFCIHEEYLDIIFVGKSFYRYMVRNLVGALLDVGRGKREKEEVLEALSIFPYERRFSTAISNGLYLEWVDYDEKEFCEKN